MYQITNVEAEIDLQDYIRDYRNVDKFIGYCKECNRYNACWACPPFDFDIEEYLSGYEQVYIIGTKITLDEQIREDYQDWDKCAEITYRIIEGVRLSLDKELLKLEKKYSQSRVFFAGTCHICPASECTKILGEPCRYPESIRPSLESVGFDVSKTSEELLNTEMKWSHEGILPEYFMLISGLFTLKSLILKGNDILKWK